MQWDPMQCRHELTKPRDTVDGLTDATLVKEPSHQSVCSRFRQSMRVGLGPLSLYEGGGVAQRGQEVPVMFSSCTWETVMSVCVLRQLSELYKSCVT